MIPELPHHWKGKIILYNALRSTSLYLSMERAMKKLLTLSFLLLIPHVANGMLAKTAQRLLKQTATTSSRALAQRQSGMLMPRQAYCTDSSKQEPAALRFTTDQEGMKKLGEHLAHNPGSFALTALTME